MSAGLSEDLEVAPAGEEACLARADAAHRARTRRTRRLV